MKKVFLITMFGSPFPWIDQFIDHVQHLEQYGWYWKIFTPALLGSTGNVELIPMTAEQYDDLVEQKLGVRPNIHVKDGKPTVHVTDFYIFSGVVFEDYLKDADFWGITNLDVVYGRLDHFFPDQMLEQCDIFTDDVKTINGVFSLWRNTEAVNNLFKFLPNWQDVVTQEECKGCLGEGKHTLYGSDEYGMTDLLKNPPEGFPPIRYQYPSYYPMLSHDRLEQHVPNPNLEIKEDGSLWEMFKDINGPEWEHARPMVGREIPYFHFQRTKRWPL